MHDQFRALEVAQSIRLLFHVIGGVLQSSIAILLRDGIQLLQQRLGHGRGIQLARRILAQVFQQLPLNQRRNRYRFLGVPDAVARGGRRVFRLFKRLLTTHHVTRIERVVIFGHRHQIGILGRQISPLRWIGEHAKPVLIRIA